MAQAAPTKSKINTEVTQPSRRSAAGTASARGKARGPAPARVGGDTRASVRSSDRLVVDWGCGVTVYPPVGLGEPWRAVFTEGGRRRFVQGASEARLAVKLERVRQRLAADAPGLERPGAELIAFYLSPERRPAGQGWSRRHADTPRRLCERFVAPVIAAVACQDLRAGHMQQVVNAAPTAGEGDRLRRCVSALVAAGISGGYLTSARLKEVHWQPLGRPVPAAPVAVAGEAAQYVDPAEIPAAADVARLAGALAAGRRGGLDELAAYTAAYSGLRQGELFALTAGQVNPGGRVIDVDRKVIEVGGQLFTEPPKGRKRRRTVYPARTPQGYPLAERLAARVRAVRADMAAGADPLGLVFPAPRGGHWRSSNFDRRVLAPAYLAAGWRDADGNGRWTWHSLRHVFCTTALFAWGLDAADASRMAGHSNVRITLDMYVGATAGVLDRARTATE